MTRKVGKKKREGTTFKVGEWVRTKEMPTYMSHFDTGNGVIHSRRAGYGYFICFENDRKNPVGWYEDENLERIEEDYTI